MLAYYLYEQLINKSETVKKIDTSLTIYVQKAR